MKSIIQKTCLILLSIALSSSCFMGCKNAEKTPVSIELWYYYSGALENNFDKYINEFNNTVGQQENIVIEGKGKGNVGDLAKALLASANNEPLSDKMPTMFASYADTACAINEIIPLATLDNYFTKAELDEYVDGYIYEGRIDGVSLKVFPIAKATETIILDIDRWDDFSKKYNAEHPTTKVSLSDFETDEGILAAAKKYYEYSDGKALFCRDSMDNYFLTGSMQLGEELYDIDENGKIKINFSEKTAKTLWDNYYIPYVKGYYSHISRFGTDCVKSGETMSSMGSTSASANYPAGINLKVLKAPIATPSAKKIYTQQGAGLCVNSSDPRTIEACSTFLKWFTEEGRNIDFSMKTGYLPVKKSANNYQTILKHVSSDTKQTTLDTIKVAIDMINDSDKMYTSKPAKFSNNIRNQFKFKFTEKCKADALELNAIIKAEGKDSASYKNALDTKISAGYFSQWYNTAKAELEAIAEKKL